MSRMRHARTVAIPRAGRRREAGDACDRAERYVVELRRSFAQEPRAIAAGVLRVLPLPLTIPPTLLGDRSAALAIRLGVAAWVAACEGLEAMER